MNSTGRSNFPCLTALGRVFALVIAVMEDHDSIAMKSTKYAQKHLTLAPLARRMPRASRVQE
jgi:hypothetical protein